ncbi:MAG: hypothetical protein HKN07_05300 [Acidimicrobiia bacterium]|nr:hypothetical protein [Acidimicrobiia bacterium]
MSDLVRVVDARYELLDTPFRVASNDEAVGPLLNELLGHFASRRAARSANTLVIRQPDERRPQFSLFRDCQTVYRGEERQGAVVALLAELNRRAIESFDTFAAHAAVIEIGGRAIAMPAESGHGKTTLTAAAVMSGFGYLSDEALCIDPQNQRVRPYSRPLLLSDHSRDLLGIESVVVRSAQEGAVVPSDLGRVVTDELPLEHVVFPEYGHDAATLEPVGAGVVMAELLKMSFNNYKDPKGAFELIASVAGRVKGWRLTYGDPFEASALMAAELG